MTNESLPWCVLGASGFVGTYLVANLVLDRKRLHVLSHREPVSLTGLSDSRAFTGDLLNPDSLDAFLVPDAVVVNLAYLKQQTLAANLEAITNLVRGAKRAGARRLIHVSSAVVVGRASGGEISESTPCNPLTAYERTKLAVEHRLLEEAGDQLEVVILRPTAVFGKGGLNLLSMVGTVRYGLPWKRYLLACLHGDRTMNVVSVHTLVAAIRFVAQMETLPLPPVFLVSDDDVPNNTYRGIEQRLLDTLGIRRHVVSVIRFPEVILQLVLRLRGRSNIDVRRRYSSQRLHALGFRKPVSLDAALAEFALAVGARDEYTQH
jgi:nucleoside-diphosphate-sugar epimerase